MSYKIAGLAIIYKSKFGKCWRHDACTVMQRNKIVIRLFVHVAQHFIEWVVDELTNFELFVRTFMILVNSILIIPTIYTQVGAEIKATIFAEKDQNSVIHVAECQLMPQKILFWFTWTNFNVMENFCSKNYSSIAAQKVKLWRDMNRFVVCSQLHFQLCTGTVEISILLLLLSIILKSSIKC